MTEVGEKAVAFVVARLSSSRFPRKQLREIGKKSIIDRIMSSLAGCDELSEVVLTTVDEPDNEALREMATEQGWQCFWYQGDVNDVVGRLVAAAQAHRAEICLLISADCPLIHGPSVDESVRQLRKQPQADYLVKPPRSDGSACLLEGVQVARRHAWIAADALSDRPELREHQFPALYQNPARFCSTAVFLDSSIYAPKRRMSVDTWADLEFMETLHTHLEAEGSPFDLPNVVALLKRRPELREINKHVHQRGLVEHPRDALFVVDAGGPFGYGHFMRCRELAGQFVERLGWPVTFLVDDERAAEMAEACGFRVQWGALGRETHSPSYRATDKAIGKRPDDAELVVVDLSVQRSLSPGWRLTEFANSFVVVMDREDEMAGESDLIVYPGVTGRADAAREGLPPVLEGLDYVILRREVRRYQSIGFSRDIDLLVYLQDEKKLKSIEALALRAGLRIECMQGRFEDFPSLLSRCRMFLSGYGQSFYEALALGVMPIAWPHSDLHRQDAEAFFSAVGVRPAIIGAADELEALCRDIDHPSSDPTKRLSDGTPTIISAIRDCMLSN